MLSKLHQNLFCFSLRHDIQVELKSDSNRAEERSKVTCPSMSFNKRQCFNWFKCDWNGIRYRNWYRTNQSNTNMCSDL